MIYRLQDTDKVKEIYAGWQETLIYSCLQNVMGQIFVTDLEKPKSALAFVGCFGFYGGEPDKELVTGRPEGLQIMVPQNETWGRLIEECCPLAKPVVRYAIKKDTKFDTKYLEGLVSRLPEGYELSKITSEIYDKCLLNAATADFVSSFENKEHFLQMGRGTVILKNGEVVSGASSYTRYLEGIEIEVDTIESERRNHLATAACAALILNCLEEGLYPSWDAQNLNSVHLAEKLGYEFDHEYRAYEV